MVHHFQPHFLKGSIVPTWSELFSAIVQCIQDSLSDVRAVTMLPDLKEDEEEEPLEKNR
jgi:hypothetical protein